MISDLDLIDTTIRQVREVGDIIVYNRRSTTIFLYSGSYIPTYTDDLYFLSRCCVNEHISTGLRWSTLDVIYLRCNVIDHNVCDRLIQRVECDPKIFAFVTHTLISIQLGVHFFLATHFLNCEYVVVTLNNGSVMKGFFNFLESAADLIR